VLHPGGFREALSLGSDTRVYLQFSYLAWPLFGLKARDYFDSPNLVARLNLPNMQYAPEEKVEVYANAVRGLRTLDADRFIEQGMQQGEAAVLMMLLQEKFGAVSVDAHRERIKAAKPDQLLRWSKRILTAETPETVFH